MTNAEMLTRALAPKSDQLNADDLITCNKIITITKVKVDLNSEQKTIVFYDGDNGKPWKPSLGMGRVLSIVMGGDPDVWTGQHVELYRDATVSFGKDKGCGGIRICAMSAIKTKTVMLITSSKGKKTSITIMPLALNNSQAVTAPVAVNSATPEPAPAPSAAREWAIKIKEAAKYGEQALAELWAMVPDNLKDEKMTDFYRGKFMDAKNVDLLSAQYQQEPQQ
jgi:hypothetical protein